ncbi:MAG: squalene/phytoene synthase family protein [Planctomycetaceae bacterium]
MRSLQRGTRPLVGQHLHGLQVTNFWQDVARDFQKGRIYLPRVDRDQFGYSRDQLDAHLENDAFKSLMKLEVDRGVIWLSAGTPLINQLSGRLRKEIQLFQLGGLRILEKIEDHRLPGLDDTPQAQKV